LKEECLNYLDKDLKSLLSVMNEFSKKLFLNYNIDMTQRPTISGIALLLFLKKYLVKNTIPLINKKDIFNFIHFAYYGGMTEVYKPYGKNLKYIDVNSLYPFASLNPMPGTECKYLEDFTDNGLNLDSLFGFFEAKVKTNDGYFGLLPMKTKNGLIFPNGEFNGV
jgi:hypothetical protein